MGYLDSAGLTHLWGKVKDVLSRKQDKLTGTAGQVVGFGLDGAAEAQNGWSNPNLLDNWYFADPINQRGQTEYSTSGYTIDRWRLWDDGTLISITDGARGVIVRSTREDGGIYQYFEQKFTPGQTITMSALTENGLITKTAVIPESGGIWQVESFGKLAFYPTEATPHFSIRVAKANSSIRVIAAKLELADRQTLAHQNADGSWALNDPQPNKALELAKCQRYQILMGQEAVYAGRTTAESDTGGLFFIPLPVTMRANPTILGFQFNNWGIYGNGNSKIPTNIAVSNISENGVTFSFACATGIGVNQAIIVNKDPDNTIFDANL